MAPEKDELREKTVDELRKEAQARGISGASEMKKEELVSALTSSGVGGVPLRAWIRDRSLGLFFLSLFLLSWIAQLIVQWYHFINEQRDHGERAEFWSGEFWWSFGQSTLENWQSEFLQLATFTIAAAYLVYKGSSESPDSDERIEQKLDALLQERGIDPLSVEQQVQPKHRRRMAG